MYIRRIEIQNIKSLDHLVWALDEHTPSAGWHVILGDNGAGKSTLLRAVALALLGPAEIQGLRTDLSAYLPADVAEGQVELTLDFDRDEDMRIGAAEQPKSSLPNCGVRLVRGAAGRGEVKPIDGDAYWNAWGNGPGWFSASFGPMRRFSGGNKEHERLFLAQPRLAAHLSLFGEDVALTEIERWLSKLRLQQLEHGAGRHFIDDLKEFINQPGLLPHGTRWEEVNSEGVFFVDGRGERVRMDQLSDGFRSILCLAFELIRQLQLVYGTSPFQQEGDEIVVTVPGVVLVDEIDAHLHPSWQQEIGGWFCRFFLNLQFFVTTHSPLVCRAAEKGTVFRLATPGAQSDSGFISGENRLRLLRGDVVAAYSTQAFGEITTSALARALTSELAGLAAVRYERELDAEERQRIEVLKAALPSPESSVAAQRGQFEALDKLLEQNARRSRKK